MLGKNEFVKIMKESVGITNRMNSLQKIEKFNLVGIKRRNIIFRGLIDQREYFDAILFFANSILFEEVISEIIGQEICHDGIEWFEANINRRELAISIGCGNTAYSKGRSGFQYFFDKATKHNKAVALKNEKNSRQLKYHITTCEKNLLNEMGEKPEIIEELEKGFTTMDKILDYAKTLPNRSNNFRWSSPSVKSTVSKRINGCSKPPYIQPKLPLICVLGIIEPEQAYENKLALRPQKSRLFSTKGLSKYVIGWEMQNESLEKTVKTSLYSRCQVIDWGERDVMKLISDEVQHIRFGVDHRKTPAGGFDSKAELQDQLGINQGQAAKVLNGSDVMQASIDKRIKRIFIAGAHYTKDEIGKYTGLTKSAVAQRIKKRKSVV